MLAEPELEGKFTKWNNNAGAVLQARSPHVARGGALGAFLEEEEDEEEEIDVYDVPQAFSHYTFEASNGQQLVCDLQGTWNEDDGFQLTDPVVHYVSSSAPGRSRQNVATDKGLDGVKKFFATHKCNALCARLRLKAPKHLDVLQRMT
ncbi:hypothetical protein OAO87_00470 [bacterium]|nr:hypothetical protein [bacterium]